MGKGSGTCDRPGISLEVTDSAKTELNLSMDAVEINTALKLQQIGQQWLTKDERVLFRKRKEGWVIFSYSNPIRKAFKEYGLMYQQAGTDSYEYTHFPSLQAAQQAVSDVSLEVGLNIDPRLTKGKSISYKIGDLPLIIKRQKGHWRVYTISGPTSILKKHFNSTQEFYASWDSTGPVATHYPTQKAAHQAVTNWLAQK
jgi:hypothetical protein